MSRSTDPGHFFQTDASEATRARRAAKSGNKNGNPIVLQSKILGAVEDPFSPACIWIAESAGCVRNVNVEVGMLALSDAVLYSLSSPMLVANDERPETRRPSIEARQLPLHPSVLADEMDRQSLQDVGTKISGAGIYIPKSWYGDTKAILTL